MIHPKQALLQLHLSPNDGAEHGRLDWQILSDYSVGYSLCSDLHDARLDPVAYRSMPIQRTGLPVVPVGSASMIHSAYFPRRPYNTRCHKIGVYDA